MTVVIPPEKKSLRPVTLVLTEEQFRTYRALGGYKAIKRMLDATFVPPDRIPSTEELVQAAVQAERDRLYGLFAKNPEAIWRDAGFQKWRKDKGM